MHLLYYQRHFSNYVFRFGSKFHIFKQILSSNAIRHLSTSALKDNVPQNNESKKIVWSPIYIFPFIHIARLLNRLKLYQTTFSIAILPITIGMYYYELTDVTTVSAVTGSAVFTCLALYVVTSFFKKLIGLIFLSEDKKHVKIAHLTFWGNRKDIVVPVEDIIPLTDGTCTTTDAYVKLYRYNSDEVLYLTLRFGRFLDKDSFQNIFGSFEILGLKK